MLKKVLPFLALLLNVPNRNLLPFLLMVVNLLALMLLVPNELNQWQLLCMKRTLLQLTSWGI